MNNPAVIILSVICNFILYLCFGSLITRRLSRRHKDEECPLLLSLVVGFFLYYFLFFLVCIGPMKYYRPLSMLTKIWVPFVIFVAVISIALNLKAWIKSLKRAAGYMGSHPAVYTLIILLAVFQAVLVSCTYNFTLDAAYYVANVATSVETNMMNVYDPFTGAWQDHYEMRYFFATYQIQDAVVCQLTHIPALVWTKSVMAITVIILTNIVYYLIAGKLFSYVSEEDGARVKNRDAAVLVMMILMFVVNLTL